MIIFKSYFSLFIILIFELNLVCSMSRLRRFPLCPSASGWDSPDNFPYPPACVLQLVGLLSGSSVDHALSDGLGPNSRSWTLRRQDYMPFRFHRPMPRITGRTFCNFTPCGFSRFPSTADTYPVRSVSSRSSRYGSQPASVVIYFIIVLKVVKPLKLPSLCM